ncbi:MAG TPA: BlaI/MecI/CopY family transcriptional regulator [Oscillatoriaceae cyanobacterium]
MKKRQETKVFRPHERGIRKVLGDLEADIMEVVWSHGPGARLPVREVHEALHASRGTAYTTVMTVMGVLAKKGLLRVDKGGFAHLYEARQTREDFTRAVVGEIVEQLLHDFAEPTLAHFAAKVEAADPEQLARLETLIAERRRQER